MDAFFEAAFLGPDLFCVEFQSVRAESSLAGSQWVVKYDVHYGLLDEMVDLEFFAIIKRDFNSSLTDWPQCLMSKIGD